jgi:4-amino-4-deoxy-L-arabinose transferase-like glycosyltransferase
MSGSVKKSGNNLLESLKRYLKLDHILLLIIAGVHGIINFMWLIKDRFPFGWDSAEYLTFSYQYHRLFASPGAGFINEFFNINLRRPPLKLFVTSPFYGIFGLSPDVAVMTNIIFLIILLFSVYGIGKYMFSREAGLLAALLISFFPIVHGLSRSFLNDFPLTAMVALSIFLMLKTENFTNKRNSIFFGVSMGLGVMTKDIYPVFLIGPLIYYMYKSSILKILWLIKTILKNIIATIIVAVSGASLGYYLYYIFSEIIWPGDPRLTGYIMAVTMLLAIVLFVALWLILSFAFYAYSKRPLNYLLLRCAILFCAFIILFAVQMEDSFTTLKEVVVLGLIAFIIFIVLEIIILREHYLAWWSRRKESQFQTHRWLNFCRSLLMGFIVSGWWYLPAARGVLPNLFLNPTYVKADEGHASLTSWESVSYYFLGLLNQQIYLFFFIFIAVLIMIFIKYFKPAISLMRTEKVMKWPERLASVDWKSKFILFTWMVVPYIFLSLSHTKNSRLIAPYLPVVAIGMAAAVLSFPKRWQKVTAVIIVLAIGVLQMSTYTFGVDSLPEEVVVDTPLGELLIFGQEPLGRFQYEIHPRADDWQVDEALKYIEDDYSGDSSVIEVGVITDGFINANVFRYTAMQEDLPMEIYSTAFYETAAWVNISEHTFYKNYDNLDYMIELQNYTLRPHFKETSTFFHQPENFNEFVLIKQFQIPDGQTLVIYRRT